jgi:hypothetical protein
MRSIQKMRYETSMAVFHADPVGAYERAIERHKGAIKRLRGLIKKLKSHKE